MLGLFDRPADEKALGALLKAPAIPGLTESLTDLSPTEWQTFLARLRRARLLAGEDPRNPEQLDTHPLVREYFGEQLRTQQTDAWKECNPWCHSLGRPLLLYVSLIGQWRCTLATGKMSTAMQIAEQVHALAQKQNHAALMIGAFRALAATLYWSADFESARQYAVLGVQIWRSENVRSSAEDLYTPAVGCLCYAAMSEWHLGEIASAQANIAEAICLAKEVNDMHALAVALYFGGLLALLQRNHAEVERLASDLIELSTRHNFAF
jgi:hypothetical protein